MCHSEVCSPFKVVQPSPKSNLELFIEMQFAYSESHPHKMCNSVDFSSFTQLCVSYHSNAGTFPSPRKKPPGSCSLCPSPSPRWPLTFFHSEWTCLCWTFHITGIGQRGPSAFGSCRLTPRFKIDPCVAWVKTSFLFMAR